MENGKENDKGKEIEKEKEAKLSNLENFIYSVTPVVPFEFVSMKWVSYQNQEKPYYTLKNFWDYYDECSSYGLGVPLKLANGLTFTQYYFPTLSAMQIYTSIPYPHSLSENKKAGDEMEMSDSLSFSDEKVDRFGYPYFQFNESCNPYSRYPLLEKVTNFSKDFPGLMSLRSIDLSPASWLSVAWYPIYAIPLGAPTKELSTCFLTYHTLSSSFLVADTEVKGRDLRLSPFGLATHNVRGNMWIGGDKDKDTLVSMFGVADSWLKQLDVEHHDFNFFIGKYRG